MRTPILPTMMLGSWLLISPALHAQTKLEPIPEPPPPPPGYQPDPALEPEVTIRDRGEDRVEEYRIRGKLYMVKVTPRIGPAYYLVDRKGDGVFVKHEGLESGLTVPQWIILRW